jgi:hypothetical protein
MRRNKTVRLSLPAGSEKKMQGMNGTRLRAFAFEFESWIPDPRGSPYWERWFLTGSGTTP